MAKDCIFCKIVAGDSPGKLVYSDDQVTAFYDIHPVSPVHILVVPNRHLDSLNEMTGEDESLLGHLFHTARQIAKNTGIDQTGYRLIINTGPNSGQVVHHLHLHVIGGQRMRFPMG